MALWPSPYPLYVLVSGITLVLFFVKRFLSSSASAPLPPGPRGLPLIGNLLDWPTEDESDTFKRWGEIYGDISHCNLIGQRMIILNSPRLVFEMLDRKGAIYSSRPHLYVACELMHWDKAPTMAPSGEHQKHMRRMITREIGTRSAIERFGPMKTREAQKFVRRILDAPSAGSLVSHIRKLSNSVILSASHGYPVVEGDDPMVNLAERVMADVDRIVVPGAFLVDSFPVLDRLPTWFPGTGFRAIAARALATKTAFLDVPHAWVKAQLALGVAQPSFVASQLEEKALDAGEDEVLKYVAGAFYGAGSETTVSALISFFLAMTLNPDVQARAQKEIAAVVGAHRLPSLADRERLPYVEAVCKEVLRWAPPLPLGLPHVLTEDDIHDGYHIPTGSYVMANIGKFTHDPETYRDPTTFDPARFVPGDGRPAEQDPRDFVFGFGRRICPGALFFNAAFFITCAMTLATLEIAKPVDGDGATVEPAVEFTSGLFSRPKPFGCTIRARSAEAEALIRDL